MCSQVEHDFERLFEAVEKEEQDVIEAIIDKKDVCSTSSIFGNYCIAIDDELLESLKHGEVLGITGEEYNIFIWHNDLKQGDKI